MEIVEKVKQFLTMRPDVAPAAFGAYTTMAPSTVRHILDGQRSASKDATAELERVLRLATAGEIFPQGADPVVISETHTEHTPRLKRQRDFYVTETVQRIAQVLTYCAEMSAIGVITAEYGAGKTEGVKAWRRGEGRKVESVIYEFDSFSASNRVDFVEGLAAAMGVDFVPGHHNGGKTLRALCAKLVESPCLLILDQCEAVRPAVMQVARQIWDRTRDAGVGMVLLASPVLRQRMLASRTRDLGALTSRVGVWAQLRGISQAEMARIVKQEGFADLSEESFRMWHRSVGGSMRRLMASIDLLKAKHLAKGRTVTPAALEGVAAHLWGMSVEAA
jgi:type II secretory pathway predicted ATPase ExeA